MRDLLSIYGSEKPFKSKFGIICNLLLYHKFINKSSVTRNEKTGPKRAGFRRNLSKSHFRFAIIVGLEEVFIGSVDLLI